MTKIRNFLNKKFEEQEGESTSLPSQTIPNQTLSLQDLVNKFTVTSEWPKEPQSEQFDTIDTIELPDVTKMTEIQKLDMAEELRHHIATSQREMQETKVKAKKPKSSKPVIPDIKPEPEQKDDKEEK